MKLRTVENYYENTSIIDFALLYKNLLQALQDDCNFSEKTAKLILKFVNLQSEDEGFYIDCSGWDEIMKLIDFVNALEK